MDERDGRERVRVKIVEFFLWDPFGQMVVCEWIMKNVYKVI